jgi:Short-chain alcohol dehydrogenase of unknown specificity
MQLHGLNALVTGGASGLGAATAERLASAGARVTIADLNEGAGEELAARIGGLFVRTDVTDPAQCAAAVTRAAANGELHVLVCCAGIVLAERILGRDGVHDPARFKRVVEVNLIGTFYMMLYAAQGYRARIRNHGHSCFLCEIVIRSQFHTTYEPEA